MQRVSRAVALAVVMPLTAGAAMSVKPGAPWDRRAVRMGQQCPKHGGKAARSLMAVAGRPKEAARLVIHSNDLNDPPLSGNGGQGFPGFAAKGASANPPAVPGDTRTKPAAVTRVTDARKVSRGGLPPCAGGHGLRYVADAVAGGADGKALETLRVEPGQWRGGGR